MVKTSKICKQLRSLWLRRKRRSQLSNGAANPSLSFDRSSWLRLKLQLRSMYYIVLLLRPQSPCASNSVTAFWQYCCEGTAISCKGMMISLTSSSCLLYTSFAVQFLGLDKSALPSTIWNFKVDLVAREAFADFAQGHELCYKNSYKLEICPFRLQGATTHQLWLSGSNSFKTLKYLTKQTHQQVPNKFVQIHLETATPIS